MRTNARQTDRVTQYTPYQTFWLGYDFITLYAIMHLFMNSAIQVWSSACSSRCCPRRCSSREYKPCCARSSPTVSCSSQRCSADMYALNLIFIIIELKICYLCWFAKLLFSSPEHEVLKWAFVILQCPASVVRRPSVRASVRPSVRASTISLNNISSETAYWILIKLNRNDPWVVLYQSCSNCSSWLHK